MSHDSSNVTEHHPILLTRSISLLDSNLWVSVLLTTLHWEETDVFIWQIPFFAIACTAQLYEAGRSVCWTALHQDRGGYLLLKGLWPLMKWRLWGLIFMDPFLWPKQFCRQNILISEIKNIQDFINSGSTLLALALAHPHCCCQSNFMLGREEAGSWLSISYVIVPHMADLPFTLTAL